MRIEGRVDKVSDEESDTYFASRPLTHRIGAWASEQSRPIPGRGTIVARAAEYGLKFGLNPPRPPHWGGYRLKPDYWNSGRGAAPASTTGLPTTSPTTAAGHGSAWPPESAPGVFSLPDGKARLPWLPGARTL